MLLPLFQSDKPSRKTIAISVHASAGRDGGGFTLVELMVVISLIAFLLAFSFPKISGFLSFNNKNKAIRWMIAQRTLLRTKAVKEQIPYVLRVDIDNNRMAPLPLPLPPAGAVSAEAQAPSSASGWTPGEKTPQPFICGGGLDITEVLFPDGDSVTDQTADIVFSEKGYCDRAIIHMKDGDTRFSIYIEPFLPSVTVYDGYIKFGQSWEALP